MALFNVHLEVDNSIVDKACAEANTLNLEKMVLSALDKAKRILEEGKSTKMVIEAVFNERLYYYYLKPTVLEEIEKIGMPVKFSCAFLEEEE